MLNFNNTLTSKIISLIIAVSFLLADISYAGAYQQGSLRVPVGEEGTSNRVKEAMRKQAAAQTPAAAPENTEAGPITAGAVKNNRTKAFFKKALPFVLVSLVSVGSGLWYFSRDVSFKEWPLGYPKANEIAFNRPVGTEKSEFNIQEGEIRQGYIGVKLPDLLKWVETVRANDENTALLADITEESFVEAIFKLIQPYSESDRKFIMAFVQKYRPKYIYVDAYFPLGELEKAIEFDSNKVHWHRLCRHLESLTSIRGSITKIKEINPNSADNLEFQWALADLQLMLIDYYTDILADAIRERKSPYEDRPIIESSEEIRVLAKEYLEFIRFVEGRAVHFNPPEGFYNNWSNQVARLDETYRYRLLRVLELDLQQLIKYLTSSSFWVNDPLSAEVKELQSSLRVRINEFGKEPNFRSDIDDLIYSSRIFKPVYDERSFAQAVRYFDSLEKGPTRQIAIENIYGVEEARQILLPLKNYVLKSAARHNLPPDYIGTIILFEKMVREGTPTYPLKVGLGHILWNLGIVKPEGERIYDVLMEAKTGNKILDGAIGLIPNIKIQDVAAQFLGVLAGASPGAGLMEIRSAPQPSIGSLEKSYPREFQEDLSARRLATNMAFKIDPSMSTRELGWKLMFDDEFNIEAGAARLRRIFDLVIEAQRSGQKANMPLLPDYSFITYSNGIYRSYDNVAVKLFGPDVFPWATIAPFVNTPGVSQILMNHKDIDLPCDLPLFSLISRQSGVLGQDNIPGIIIGINSLDRLEILIKFIEATGDQYLKEAGIRTLIQLKNDPDEKISNRAREYLKRSVLGKGLVEFNSIVMPDVTASAAAPVTLPAPAEPASLDSLLTQQTLAGRLGSRSVLGSI